MRVLITGVAGFAGRYLAEHSADQGATVIGAGRRQQPDGEPPGGVDDYVRADLLDASEARKAVRTAAPERVFHLAAEASVARSWDRPEEIIAGNVLATLNLLEAVRREAPAARVLVACSGEEYGKPRRLPVTEEDPLRPQNPYAVSKASADLLTGFYADAHGLHAIRARAFNHAGPGQTETYVVAGLARQIAEAEARGDHGGQAEITVGNTEVRRDFTDVRDVVRAYWVALEGAEPGVYNVSSGRATSIIDILAGLAAQSELKIGQRSDPGLLRENEVMEICASHDKLTRATGWEPEIPLERTLADTLDWWRAKVAARVPS